MAGSEWQKSGIPWRPRGRVRPFLAVHVCAGSVESKPSEPDAAKAVPVQLYVEEVMPQRLWR